MPFSNPPPSWTIYKGEVVLEPGRKKKKHSNVRECAFPPGPEANGGCETARGPARLGRWQSGRSGRGSGTPTLAAPGGAMVRLCPSYRKWWGRRARRTAPREEGATRPRRDSLPMVVRKIKPWVPDGPRASETGAVAGGRVRRVVSPPWSPGDVVVEPERA